MPNLDLNLAALDERYGRLRVTDRRRETQLMASLEEQGQQDAIIVVEDGGGRYAVVDGHKRVRALRRLRRDTVKAEVWAAAWQQALATAYRSANRQGYNAIEEGWLVYELHRVGKWELGKAAAALGRSKSWASRRLGLVEQLPDWLAQAVAEGRLGAHAAATYLAPLTRVNGEAGRALAERILGMDLSNRQMKALCAGYRAAGAATRDKIAQEPGRFLQALEVAGKGSRNPALSEAEDRALKSLDLVGNVALGLVRSLPRVLGYDAGPAARGVLWPAWERAAKRLALLAETAAAMKAAQGKNREADYAESGSTDGDHGAARARPRQPQDRAGHGSESDGGQGGFGQRAAGGGAAVAAAPS